MKSKIRQITGQRIGQLIYNSINYSIPDNGIRTNSDIADIIFYAEDDELIKYVKDYITHLNKG